MLKFYIYCGDDMIFTSYAQQQADLNGMRIVSCGHIFAKPGREICRPAGRNDWLLFFVAKGTETFYLQETTQASAGSFILFAPKQKQHHIFNGPGTGEFYYVHFHFDGTAEQLGLSTSQVYSLPFHRQVCQSFDEIIEELLQKQPLYEQLCLHKLMHLITLLRRDVLQQSHPSSENLDRIARAVQHMNRYYSENYTLEDYAQLCGMSKYHFLRVFRELVGATPLDYRNNIRLEHAAELLQEESLSIEEVSTLTGYASASYFSSAFKRKFGVSPKQYQNSSRLI